jgi:hypothetical protein
MMWEKMLRESRGRVLEKCVIVKKKRTVGKKLVAIFSSKSIYLNHVHLHEEKILRDSKGKILEK